MRYSIVLLSVVFAVALSNAQEPITSNNPPEILNQSNTFGSDSVLDSLSILRTNIDAAQAEIDSLTPVSNFVSAAHRAAFYRAAAQLKKANASLFSYMAQVDPNNRLNYLAQARQSKRQADIAMVEYYKALPSEGEPVYEHHSMKLDINN